ncbi:hypothetical protein BUALT_Bualt05G0048500 [Buddleja alternifolia]|uniref:FAD-binding PCMH-type domain-containing protein n=1 Tax=Buddleja alternifolia TaxID=168488 RepID=A0AAV6XNL5_9LAMI|nr:hypothetical protein BUALT_Bualt05G0048500 [Buddleja alternifolia]
MKTPTTMSTLTFILFVIFACSWEAFAHKHEDFLECLSHGFENSNNSISNVVYTPKNSSYSSILRFSTRNLRFISESTPKPLVIITPTHELQVLPVIRCAKENDVQIRTRSGGHDYEGLSYVSQVRFVVLDLINLDEISVDAEQKVAWVGSGANIGSLYYRIAEKSPTLGFPAGLCPTIGTGGHFSGGGEGTLMRKYGLSADNVIDARIMDVNGRILDRKSMGEDLFWAIRGGGGASFGVILAWKVQLVDVPERVTVFTIQKTLEQNATQLVHRWQYIAHKFDKNLFLRIILDRVPYNNSQDGRNITISAKFNSLFLGGVDQLVPLMQESFPELGLVREDCTEMSWIQSVLYFEGAPINTPEMLLNKTKTNIRYFRGKSDYVQTPIPEYGLEGIWDFFYEAGAEQGALVLNPYGGRMAEISESTIPFPHRVGNLYNIQHLVFWREENVQRSDMYASWIRRVYDYMTPYVSSSPRAAHINYRDLDIGVNNNEGKISYADASIWGIKYFKNNFDRLVQVKTKVDPGNFFRYEQSIPTLHKGN